jgi:hypothetical protein
MGARRRFDAAFREGAVRIVTETGRPQNLLVDHGDHC